MNTGATSASVARLLPRNFWLAITFVFFTSWAQAQTATLKSDQDDYAPLSTAILTGTGFDAGETVILQVLPVDYNFGDPVDEHNDPWNVTADADGKFVTSWHVCDCLGATLRA